MAVLHLGVVNIPYAQRPTTRAKKTVSGTQTTGDVAEILEAKYGVMATFFDAHKTDIARSLEDKMSGELENLLMGKRPNSNALAAIGGDIQKMFADFLDMREIESMGVAGVPTQAALMGVNHRLKSGRGSPRPSFIDTGLYQASFRAWVD